MSESDSVMAVTGMLGLTRPSRQMNTYDQLILHMRTMDLAALRVFKAVAEEGGITAAARKLHRVQSNVTMRIQQLEASLGAQLFVRDKRRLFLAPAGEVLLHYADRMLDLSREARDAVASDVPRGVLRIGTMESTAASRLPPLLSRYHRAYPQVRIELTTGTTDALVDALLRRRVEAAFVAECAQTTALEVLAVYQEELVLIASASHPPIRRARDLRTDTIIAFPAGCAYRRRLQAWLSEDDVMPEKVLELASYHAIVACVASGTGIALVPRSVLRTLAGLAAIGVHPLGAKMNAVTTSLVWRKEEPSRPLKALRDALSAPSSVKARTKKHQGRAARATRQRTSTPR